MTTKVIFKQLSVFTQEIDKGNSAAVVLDAEQYTSSQMQKIAQKIGFNETTFVLNSERCDFRLRYFSPKSEMRLCGHGTLAASACLLNDFPNKKTLIYETLAGDIRVTKADSVPQRFMMQQQKAQFTLFTGAKSDLAQVLSINESEIDSDLPLVYASTGTWTLLIPVKTRATLSKMVPNNQAFPSVLKSYPFSSIHPFCLEADTPQGTLYGRHFSGPQTGTREDAVTGTANGALGAYYKHYIEPLKTGMIVEQGAEMQRFGQVFVQVDTDLAVTISGEVSPIVEKEMKI